VGLDHPLPKSCINMDKSKIDLNAPAFGQGSQKVTDVSEENKVIEPEPIAESKPEVKKEEVTAEPSAEGSAEDEEPKRVTYSRFKNVWSRAEAAEQAAEEAKREADEWRRKAEHREPVEVQNSTEVPNWWTKLYGDSDASAEAWKVQSRANAELKDQLVKQAREEALEAVQNERYSEDRRVTENLHTIDSNMEQLEALTGRELTEKEQSAILDIVDDYTPKDNNGDYLGPTIPFEKAWEIYELKTQAAKAPKTQSRDNVAAISASQSQGEPSTTTEKDKSFNPLDWNAWKRRI
jgi:hypothetical protein